MELWEELNTGGAAIDDMVDLMEERADLATEVVDLTRHYQSDTLATTALRIMERHTDALLSVIRDFADDGAEQMLENLGNYLNGCDAVDDQSIDDFDRAIERCDEDTRRQARTMQERDLLHAFYIEVERYGVAEAQPQREALRALYGGPA